MKTKILYYQWMSVILVLQCSLFIIPSKLWETVISMNGFNIVLVTRDIVRNAYTESYKSIANWAMLTKISESVTDHLRLSFLNDRKKLMIKHKNKIKYEELNKNNSNYRKENPNLRAKASFPLFVPYLIIKVVYLLNVVLQFVLLGAIFQFDFYKFGLTDFKKIFFNQYVQQITHIFPLRSHCFYSIHNIDNRNGHVIQCSLPINFYNYFFYFFFWFWLIFLSVSTIGSIVYWSLFFIPMYRRRVVLKLMQFNDRDNNYSNSYTAVYYRNRIDETIDNDIDLFMIDKTGMSLMENFDLFFRDVCTLDVTLVINLIGINSNWLAARDILHNLWFHYLDIAKEENLSFETIKRPMMRLKIPKTPLIQNEENEIEPKSNKMNQDNNQKEE
jgi:hypothetical protein